MTRQTVPAALLADVKNYLNITWDDEATNAKISGLIASAAAYLDGNVDGVADAANDVGIAAIAGKSAVQIDDMQEHSPFIAPLDGRLYGVVKVSRAVFLHALAQADDLAALYIYRRKYDHSLILSLVRTQ